jgi:PDZ domain-containing protein
MPQATNTEANTLRSPVSLFGDSAPVGSHDGYAAMPAPDAEQAARLRAERRRTRGWTILVVALVLGLVMSFLPTSYVIEQPGPVYDTLGSQQHDNKDTPLISIDGEPTFPTAGSLDMLTVSVVGTPERTPNWAEVVQAFLDPSKAVVPIEAIYPPEVTTDERNEQNAAQMTDSQQEAIAAALLNLGYDVTQTVSIAQVTAGSPAEGKFETGDIVQSVNGQPVTSIDSLRAAVTANGTTDAASVEVKRGDATQTVTAVPTKTSDGSIVLGVGVAATFGFPFDVTIQLDNVGGPSAGMMFALGIIDKLTDGKLNGGQRVAGTGTITSDGAVGAIGGIRQKLFAARDAGAKWFLAPSSNCNEVVGHVPDGISVFAVSTLDDSLTALKAISSGGSTASLTSCDAVMASAK